jgi:hypothetical protein
MFFTIKLHSRIFGFGKSKHHKDPYDTNLGSRIKQDFFRQDVRNPPLQIRSVSITVIPGKTKVVAGLFTLVRFDLSSTTTAH